MKVSVDRDLCYGSGECAFRVPSVFTVRDGFGAVLPGRVGTGGDPEVREAAEKCPSQAIMVTGSGGLRPGEAGGGSQSGSVEGGAE
ncbi:ferredoxin [Streptomyces sp. NPDC046197]|uniref:ferredoxin n=1 Tax=Streptomyces sp. NPDC046197 TaxID=3154337 RepID=UPI0033EF0449